MHTNENTIAPSREGRNIQTSEPTSPRRQTSPRPWYLSRVDEHEFRQWNDALDGYRAARRLAFNIVRRALVLALQGDEPVAIVHRAGQLGPEGLDDLRRHLERARALVEALPIVATLAELGEGGGLTAAEVAARVENTVDEMARYRGLEVGLLTGDEDQDVEEVMSWPVEERRRRARDFFLARLSEVEAELAAAERAS